MTAAWICAKKVGSDDDRLDRLEAPRVRAAVARLDGPAGVPGHEDVAARADRDGHRADAPVGDLEGRAEGAAGAAQAHHDAVVRAAEVAEVGDRRVALRVDASFGIPPSECSSTMRRARPEGAVRAAERDGQPGREADEADRALGQRRWPASARRPRRRSCPPGRRARGRTPRTGRARGEAHAGAAPGGRCRPATTTTPAPCRRRRRSHRPGRRTGAAWTRSASATTAGRPRRRPGARGPASQASATRRRIMALQRMPRARSCARGRLHRLNGGQHRFRNNRRRRSMPPAHELTAPSPRVPALTVPRVAVRYRVALAVLALTALTFLIPSAPTYDPWAWIVWGREILHLDLSTVDGPSWKPLPVLLTTPVRPLRRPRPGPVAVRRTRRRHRRRRHGLPGRAAAWRSAGRRRRRGRLRRRAVDAAQLGARQLRGPARGAGAGRGRPPPRRAHPPRLPLRDRRRAAAPRGLALDRPLRAVAVLARSRGAQARRRGLRRAARPVAAARAVGLGRPAARRAPGAQPARQQRRLLRRPDPRGGAPVRRRCSRRRCGSAWGRSSR